MDEMTQQNAALVEETTVGSRSMTDQAHELHRMMERYRLAAAPFRAARASSSNSISSIRLGRSHDIPPRARERSPRSTCYRCSPSRAVKQRVSLFRRPRITPS